MVNSSGGGIVGAGSVIILSGTSCSGKTTIARALQESLEVPYLYVGLDLFEAMQPTKSGQRIHVFYGQAGDGTWHPERDLVHIMHKGIAAFAAEGMNVIVEHIFLRRRWLRDAVLRFNSYPVLFVGVQCPLDELVRREQEREGQNPSSGQAARQLKELAALDRYAPYDVVVNTAQMTTAECARAITDCLYEGPSPLAFQRLRPSPFLDELDTAAV